MRVHANLPASLRFKAFKAARYIANRIPKRKLGWKTPYKVIYGRKPNLAHLRTYGCRAYLLRNKIPKLEKLAPRAYIGYLVGYNLLNIYRIWILSRNKVI